MPDDTFSRSSPTASSSRSAPVSSPWHSRFGWKSEDGVSKEPLRRWVAISLIMLPTIALMVPGYRVYRMSRTAKLSAAAPPPVRTTKASRTALANQQSPALSRPLSSSSLPLSHLPPRSSGASSYTSSSPPPRIRSSKIVISSSSSLDPKPNVIAKDASTPTGDEPDAAALEAAKDPLYAAGAFGVATALVTLGLFAGVWGTRTLLGVDTVDEFAMRMRSLVRRHIPQLSQALYKHDKQFLPDPSSGHESPVGTGTLQWDASTSEERLREAFDRGGVEAWAECALREMEAERRLTMEAARTRT